MDLLDLCLLGAAGVAAGGVNAIAGGGSLISFPALLAVGCPNITANVTNTVALWPGYVGGVAGYRAELDGQRGRAIALSVTGVIGAVAGCVLLLVTPASVFAALVPALIALASLLLAAQPWLRRRLDAARRLSGNGHRMMLHGGVLVGGAYGAYFGAGLGVMLLGLLGVFVRDHLQRLNAVRAVLSLVINTVALAAFALFGPVRWPAASSAPAWPGACRRGCCGPSSSRSDSGWPSPWPSAEDSGWPSPWPSAEHRASKGHATPVRHGLNSTARRAGSARWAA